MTLAPGLCLYAVLDDDDDQGHTHSSFEMHTYTHVYTRARPARSLPYPRRQQLLLDLVRSLPLPTLNVVIRESLQALSPPVAVVCLGGRHVSLQLLFHPEHVFYGQSGNALDGVATHALWDECADAPSSFSRVSFPLTPCTGARKLVRLVQLALPHLARLRRFDVGNRDFLSLLYVPQRSELGGDSVEGDAASRVARMVDKGEKRKERRAHDSIVAVQHVVRVATRCKQQIECFFRGDPPLLAALLNILFNDCVLAAALVARKVAHGESSGDLGDLSAREKLVLSGPVDVGHEAPNVGVGVKGAVALR